MPFLAGLCLLFSGCASAPQSSAGSPETSFVDKALSVVGLETKKPQEALQAARKSLEGAQPRSLALRIHAGEVLNTDASGRPLAVVARIYTLRSFETFIQSPWEEFQKPQDKARELPFEKDVVAVREIVLRPGQKLETLETLGPEVGAVAVVALFRAPDPQRWRFVFDARQAAATGITLGAHGCALSVAQGQPLAVPPETLRVAGARCRA